MFVRNAENEFSKDDLFYCYSPKLKKFLCQVKNISYIGKGINSDTNKTYWLFIRNKELNISLDEWSSQSKKLE
jgi:hypothetical protein